MAYTEPGVIVRTELADAGVVVQSADQDPVIVGEMYEVFEDQVAAARYEATTDAGAQVFVWPGKKTASVVDLAGVRDDTAEPDSQLRESAAYPMIVKLRDPTTLVKVTLDPITDITTVGQTGFTIVEGVDGATAKLSAADATGAESNKVRVSAGGIVAAGVKIGDKIRVSFTEGASSLRGTITSFTDTEITYSTTETPVVDTAELTGSDGDALTTSGSLVSATGGFTADLSVGDRVALWTEALQVNDGNATSAAAVTTATGMGLVSADVGRRVTIHSAVVADGAITPSNGATNGTNTLTATGILSTMKGRVVKISGGTLSLTATYRRVVTAGAGTLTFSGAVIASGTGASVIVFKPFVRTIATVVAAGSFTYSGGDVSNGSQTAIPVFLHTRVLRDVTVINSDTSFAYSGSALTSTTGFLLNVPFDTFSANVGYDVFPDYQVLVSYRALDVSLVAGQRVTQASDVSDLGAVSKFNPLLFAASLALRAMGTDDRNLLLVAVNPWQHMTSPSGLPGDRDTATAYDLALEVLSNDPAAYYFAPLTRVSAIRDAFDTHVTAMSQPTEKRERTVVLSYALPVGEFESTTGGIEPGSGGGNKSILDPGQGFVGDLALEAGAVVVITSPAAYAGSYEVDGATTDDELVLAGDPWTLTPVFTVANGNFDAVSGRVASATTGVWKDVDVGDWIVSGGEYRRVTAKVNNQTLTYTGTAITGTGATVSVLRSSLPPNEPVVYYVTPLTKTEQATVLAGLATSRANFRVVNVWPDLVGLVTGQDNAGNDVVEDLESWYLAAMTVGELAVLPPENSSTGQALAGVSRLVHSNNYFSTTQLNTIANGGWTIYVQPTPGGSAECRQLMSTDRSSIKRTEFSVTKNVDNQAKVIRASLAPSLNDENGRKNITPKFLDALMLPLHAVLKFLADEDQIVPGADGTPPYRVLGLIPDPDNADHILARVRTNQPLPCNVLDITYVI